MGWDFYVAVGSIVLAALLGLSLARYNLKVLHDTKQERLERRRAEKKIKNEKLKRFLGL